MYVTGRDASSVNEPGPGRNVYVTGRDASSVNEPGPGRGVYVTGRDTSSVNEPGPGRGVYVTGRDASSVNEPGPGRGVYVTGRDASSVNEPGPGRDMSGAQPTPNEETEGLRMCALRASRTRRHTHRVDVKYPGSHSGFHQCGPNSRGVHFVKSVPPPQC